MTEPKVRSEHCVIVAEHELDFEKIYLEADENCEVL